MACDVCLQDMNNNKPGKPQNPEGIKKANPDPVEEALGHPNGPNLREMLNGEEEKVLKKKKRPENNGPEAGPIPIIWN
jgi:hypothetical protein